MRSRFPAVVAIVIVSASAGAHAQATLPVPTDSRDLTAAAFTGKVFGNVDFGGRFTGIDGDEARYQRYRDLRDGPFVQNAAFSRRGTDWTLEAIADNIGYRDQRFGAEYRQVGKLSVNFLWDQIPLYISSDTRTLYTQVQPGIFRLEDVMQANNEAKRTTIRDYADQAAEFELRTQRNVGALAVEFNATRAIDVTFKLDSTTRTGAIPYGATFGFNNLVELPAPIDQRTTDAKALFEWANQKALFSVGWDGSWFANDVQTMIWDNPLKITDAPSYSSAYSDGLGPSQARMAMWPTNTQQYVHATGSVATPGRGRLIGYIAAGASRQDQPLLPHTINPQIPAIALIRPSAEAEIRNTMFNLQYTARPINQIGVIARYRYVDIDNRTPHFETLGRVRFDGAADDGAASPEPEPYGVTRKTFDLDGTFTVLPFTALKVGYTNAITVRTFRVFEEAAENTVRASLDATGQQYFSVRAMFESSSREGDGLDLDLLATFGEQPGMRHFDVADRDRKRFTVIATATPTNVIGFTASAGAGRDEYPGSEFGLQAQDSNQYSVGVDIIPSDRLGFTVLYAWEAYTSLTQSRTAAAGPQFIDPLRNWLMDYDGTVKNVDASVEVVDLVPRTDLRVNVNWSDAHDRYTYVLVPGTVLPAPQQLDPVVNELLRGTVDLSYRLSSRLRLAVGYWFEDYRTKDFALGPLTISDVALPAVQPGFPIVATNSLLLGYLYRPYTAHTGMVRLSYRF